MGKTLWGWWMGAMCFSHGRRSCIDPCATSNLHNIDVEPREPSTLVSLYCHAAVASSLLSLEISYSNAFIDFLSSRSLCRVAITEVGGQWPPEDSFAIF